MPLIHTRTFRVRYYECDAYGHLNNANYLRYMQEAAFDASAAAGYDFSRYAEMGQHWLIRETEIEYLRPLRYGEAVEVKTWVADFHRVRSRRMYEIRLRGTEELAARGSTDWVFLDTGTGRPVSIPRPLAEAFFPEGLPAAFPPRRPFPTAPLPPPGVFEIRRRVAWRDLDSAQHVNNAVYLEYVEECGMQVIAAHGWPVARMSAAGFAILLRRHQIQYLQPAFLDDELLISTWASDVRRSSAVRHYQIRRARDRAVIANVHTLGVWIDLASGRPIRIPPAFLADFAPNIVYGEKIPG
jgi:acyl-CoA thioester hydrolase